MVKAGREGGAESEGWKGGRRGYCVCVSCGPLIS